MKRPFIFLLLCSVIAVLALMSAVLLIENRSLKASSHASPSADSNFKYYSDGEWLDLRGLYTYPGIGEALVPRDSSGEPKASPLSLAIFLTSLSSAADCPNRLPEFAVYKRLQEVLSARGQQMFVIVSSTDSVAVAEQLHSEGLELPIVVYHTDESEESITFEQMGISQFNMPFKVVFDSSFTSIYMRGADNSLESQTRFERAVLRLSELVYEGKL